MVTTYGWGDTDLSVDILQHEGDDGDGDTVVLHHGGVVGNDASLGGTGDLHPCLRDICAALLYHLHDSPQS